MNKHKFIIFCSVATSLAVSATAATLPKASEIQPKMGLGYNIGNTMEVPGNPTLWGNPFPTKAYIDSIKAAGFNTVRIPCAWDSHAKNGSISSWLDSVKTVVDMVLSTGAYVILNSHWDNGWLEDHVFDGQGYDKTGLVNSSAKDVAAKQENYWKQIANKFKDYNERLIFACANEPGVNDPWNGGTDNGQWGFDAARMNVLKTFHEACIKAVRSTGGNNATRTIVVQTPRTEIDKYQLLLNNYPSDPAGDGYTMAEAHFYPYQFSLMNADADWGKTFWYWEEYTAGDASRTCSGNCVGSKSSIDSQFDKLKTAFVNKGIPVVIGEMGAIKRLQQGGINLSKHLEARAAWYGYTVKAAKNRGIIPVVWDTGYEGNENMTIIRRQINSYGGKDGAVIDLATLNSMRNAYGLGDYTNKEITHVNNFISGTIQLESSSSFSQVQGSSSSSSNNVQTALNAMTKSSFKFYREENTLYSASKILLFDMNGNLIRSTNSANGKATMHLQGLPQGTYLAHSNNKTMRIFVK